MSLNSASRSAAEFLGSVGEGEGLSGDRDAKERAEPGLAFADIAAERQRWGSVLEALPTGDFRLTPQAERRLQKHSRREDFSVCSASSANPPLLTGARVAGRGRCRQM